MKLKTENVELLGMEGEIGRIGDYVFLLFPFSTSNVAKSALENIKGDISKVNQIAELILSMWEIPKSK